MSDGRPKPSIPAWQRTAQTRSLLPTEDSADDEAKDSPVVASEPQQPLQDEDAAASARPEDTSSEQRSTAEVFNKQQPAFHTSDFESFKQPRPPVPVEEASTSPPQQQRLLAPPIITYPEFLVEAHKPPPLITPARLLNSVYAAGGAAALLYGASKWIINPMVETLSESRHDFLSHSHGKVEELNARLSKVVSKLPEAKQEQQVLETDIDEADSETSDPTELYHRDMGTQTSPLPSRRSSLPDSAPEPKKDEVTYSTGALEIMKEHISEIADGYDQAAEASKERQDTFNKLRHYLDGLLYGGVGYAWQSSEDAMVMKNGDVAKEDPVEELKKEIRGVKGVLLSAKRFPAVSRPLTGAA